MSIDFKAQLNRAQLEAVTAGDGPYLVIAAAGTGKTRTLVHRVAWLLQERNVEPWQIWLLTFTNRAAREMLERAAALTPLAADVPGGTFHHMANIILRRHATRLGYAPVFSILDEEDSTKLMKSCVNELGLLDKTFPKPGVIASIVSLAANRCSDLEADLEERFGHSRTVKVEDVKAVAELYGRRKREMGAMDFDDLLVNAVRLLREHPDVAEEYQRRIRYLLVDEYQDTNRLQSAFIDLLSKVHSNLMAVGDDFQSIYGWRGADVTHILGFEKRHPGAKVIKLEENYRSTPSILTVANRVIEGNPEQFQKVLRATRREQSLPKCVSLANGQHQAVYAISQIRQLLKRPDIEPRDIAVLYRAHFHALDLQMEMMRQKMPFELMSGPRFFDQAHVKDVCSVLHLVVNPQNRMAARRLLELFPKIGPKKADAVFDKLGQRIDFLTAEGRKAFLAALPELARSVMEKFFELVLPAGLSGDEEAQAKAMQNPSAVIQAFMKAFYKAYLPLAFDNADQREDDIGALMEEVSRYESSTAFIEEMALLSNLDTRIGGRSKGAGENAIRLSTIHQAKGLEWKAVFILWAVDGMLPSYRALDDDDFSAAGGLAEERRLFYVAVTRAKDFLQVLVPKTRRTRDGSIDFTTPSRFLGELDLQMMDHEEPPPPASIYPPGRYSRYGSGW